MVNDNYVDSNREEILVCVYSEWLKTIDSKKLAQKQKKLINIPGCQNKESWIWIYGYWYFRSYLIINLKGRFFRNREQKQKAEENTCLNLTEPAHEG